MVSEIQTWQLPPELPLKPANTQCRLRGTSLFGLALPRGERCDRQRTGALDPELPATDIYFEGIGVQQIAATPFVDHISLPVRDVESSP